MSSLRAWDACHSRASIGVSQSCCQLARSPMRSPASFSEGGSMSSSTRRQFLAGFVLCTSGLLAEACSPAAPAPTGATPATASAPTTAPQPGATTAAAVTAPPVTVRITDIQITSAAGSYIAAENGYFKTEGIDPQFLPVGAADQVTAIVADSADVAGAA